LPYFLERVRRVDCPKALLLSLSAGDDVLC
jgi:hypothetical protein